jgi:hypothetical protein
MFFLLGWFLPEQNPDFASLHPGYVVGIAQ